MQSEPGGTDLNVGVSDHMQYYPSTLVAGRSVTLVGTWFVFDGETGCERAAFASGAPVTATVELPPGVALRGAPATQTVPFPARFARSEGSGEAPVVVNLRWRVRIARPGPYRGRLTVSASTRDGTTCRGVHDFTIAGVAAGPRFRVVETYLERQYVVAVVSADLPPRGLSRSLRQDALGDALMEWHHPLGAEYGRSELDLLRLTSAGRRLPVLGGGTSTGNRFTCLHFRVPRGSRPGVLDYRLRFDWNKEKGFATRTRRGTLRPLSRARTRPGRQCAREHPTEIYESL